MRSTHVVRPSADSSACIAQCARLRMVKLLAPEAVRPAQPLLQPAGMRSGLQGYWVGLYMKAEHAICCANSAEDRQALPPPSTCTMHASPQLQQWFTRLPPKTGRDEEQKGSRDRSSHLVQWGHAHIDVPRSKQFRHVAEKEGEQQGPDVSTVHISIRQQDDLRTTEVMGGTAAHQWSIAVLDVRWRALSALHKRCMSAIWHLWPDDGGMAAPMHLPGHVAHP